MFRASHSRNVRMMMMRRTLLPLAIMMIDVVTTRARHLLFFTHITNVIPAHCMRITMCRRRVINAIVDDNDDVLSLHACAS